jgi:peptidyl-prolyl cis-trans isomerase C
MRNISIFSVVILLFIISCKESEQQKPFIAKVGDVYLTAETIEQYIGSSFDTSDGRVQVYVNKWIENELLYQQALKKGYADSDALEKQLADIRKQLVVQGYLDKEIYTAKESMSEDGLKNYYNQHTKELALREDIVKINIAVFNDRQPANDFRTLLLKGKNWLDVNAAFSRDETKSSAMQSNLTSMVYTKFTLYPPELWKVLQSLQKNDASFPVKSGDLFYVVQLLEKSPKGSVSNYETVKDEVRSRLFIEKRREKYSKLLDNLRKEFKVEVNLKNLGKEK